MTLSKAITVVVAARSEMTIYKFFFLDFLEARNVKLFLTGYDVRLFTLLEV